MYFKVSKLILNIPAIIFSYGKIILYKILYINILKIDYPFNIFMRLGSKIIIEDKRSLIHIANHFRTRNNVELRLSGGNLDIGENVFLNNNCTIICKNSIKIGNNCLFGENVKIYDHDHEFKLSTNINDQGFSEAEINIGNNVWIASNVTILKGVTIGDNVVIGAGSIVNSDISSNSVMYSKRENVIKIIKNSGGDIYDKKC